MNDPLTEEFKQVMGSGLKRSESKRVIAYFDGACEPFNPGGHASYGAVIYQPGQAAWENMGMVGSGPGMTNNVAEYAGLIAVLKRLIELELQDQPIVINGDSKLVIAQMRGLWRAKRGLYIAYHRECKALAIQFQNIAYEWIPREMNGEADRLSKAILVQQGIRLKIQP